MNILLVEHDPLNVELYTEFLQSQGHIVSSAVSGEDALRLPENTISNTDVALIDRRMPGLNSFDTGRQLRRMAQHLVTVMLTTDKSMEGAIEALRDHDFDDYLSKAEIPHRLSEVLNRAERISSQRREHIDDPFLSNLPPISEDWPQHQLIGHSSAYVTLIKLINLAAKSDKNVIIEGETGTGKELVARRIHELSNRKHEKFIAVNCAAIPEELLESEFFGHTRGAFTGAIKDKKGLLEQANNGTLFLDEIGDMPLSLQAKLLRVLEVQTVTPLGSHQARPINVRVLCATHRDLRVMIEQNRFRKDLFFRICVIPVYVPSLQQRQEDIEDLARYFMQNMDTSKDISPQALRQLKSYSWPGNIRELKNAIDRAMTFSIHSRLQPEDFDFLKTPNITTSKCTPPLPFEDTDHALLWSNFEKNGCKLWRIIDDETIQQQLIRLFEQFRYVKKGHTGRLIAPHPSAIEVPIEYLCPTSKSIEHQTISFHFYPLNTLSRSGLSVNTQGIVHQDVIKGLPDTYLFKLLYPHSKAASSTTKILQALVLRYILDHDQTLNLKSVFQQLMPPLVDEEVALRTLGLRAQARCYTGTDALRAYLCSKQTLFYGIASELKRNPQSILHRIQDVFPDYKR